MKKKVLIVGLAVLCAAAIWGKVVYDRRQKEAFVDALVAKGEALAQSYRENGVDGYQVRSGKDLPQHLTVLSTPYTGVAATAKLTHIPDESRQLPADQASDRAVQALLDSMTLIWIRDEAIPTLYGYDLLGHDSSRLILTQDGESQEFTLTLTEDHGLLTQSHRVQSRSGVGLYLEFSVDKDAASFLLEQVLSD